MERPPDLNCFQLPNLRLASTNSESRAPDLNRLGTEFSATTGLRAASLTKFRSSKRNSAPARARKIILCTPRDTPDTKAQESWRRQEMQTRLKRNTGSCTVHFPVHNPAAAPARAMQPTYDFPRDYSKRLNQSAKGALLLPPPARWPARPPS
jgi:hypothetical protein